MCATKSYQATNKYMPYIPASIKIICTQGINEQVGCQGQTFAKGAGVFKEITGDWRGTGVHGHGRVITAVV